jgi:alkanesulfonate monooxygenase SsuD/methylene tetrahydromethanopterin reductase-like flavin-dependent oxidoreductase (luciferase family)
MSGKRSGRKRMRSGLYLPLFDPLADPAVVAHLAGQAEEAGWDGFFVWDHIRWREPVEAVGDTQVTLAAIVAATERIRFGPLVTPLARRRPAKVARETAALDRLSGGRLTFGVGLGGDDFAGEYSITGEELDEHRRARMLDESLEILVAAWSGEPVRHHGEHYTVDAMRFLPRPLQQPRVPIWVAGIAGRPKPMRRAARYDGFFPMHLESADQLAEIVARVGALREEAGHTPDEPYEVIAELEPGADPAPFGESGATWVLAAPDWEGISVDRVRGLIREGPVMEAR